MLLRRRARKANAKGDFTAAQWKDRLAYHGYKCVYCGAEKHETPEGWLSCDHMIPLSKGGTNWPSNLVPACRSCNSSKGAKTYFQFMEYLERKNNE
jgi:5-methylcytosine-specific restriction endonuclease McrA